MNRGAGGAREHPSPPPAGRGTGGGPVLFLDEPFRTLWAGRDPFEAAFSLEGEVRRQLEARRTLRFEAAGRGYYVKLHRGVGWGEIAKNLATGRLPVVGADNEWQAIRRLEELGVATMKAVAYGRRGANPARQESFVITEELAPTISLEDFCRDWPAQPPPPALKRALIARVADMTRRMHEGGMNHRDYYLCHFLLHLDPPPAPDSLRVSLIDLHRAQLRGRTPRRWRDKDLASLHFSTMLIGLTSRDRMRFLRAYFGRPLRDIFRDEAALLAFLEREGARLMKRYRLKFSVDVAREKGGIAEVEAETLRRAGRQPHMPIGIALEDGRRLTIHRLLRILPGKRLTGAGEIEGRPVLAKLFIDGSGADRHWRHERHGLEALAAQGIPAPRLLAAGSLEGGDGRYLLTEFLEDARPPVVAADTVPQGLTLVFETLGCMHARGLAQDDLHLGNFLVRDGQPFVIDGAAIRQGISGRPLDAAAATRNLALLLAQLPPAMLEDALPALLAAYRGGHPGLVTDPAQLRREIDRAREWRLRNYLAKCIRDCSRFKVVRRRDRFLSVAREEAEWLAPLLADPDRWMQSGAPLKQGRTSTLALVEHAGRKVVIKRYNIKGASHALSRFWRPSRAWHSWIEGHRLLFHGIATPRPLALVESRIGPLRGRAWLFTEFCEGPNLRTRLAPHIDSGAPAALKASVRSLFASLVAARIGHGDLKATNFLCRGEELAVLDLDAMRQFDGEFSWRAAWRKDRERFLRNWPEGSALRRELDGALPPA